MQGTSIATSGIFYNTAGLGFIDGIFLTVACTPYNWGTLVQGWLYPVIFQNLGSPSLLKSRGGWGSKDGLRTQTLITDAMAV